VLALIQEIVDWLGPLFASWGYLIIFLAVVSERSILIGLFVPGDVIIALGGVYAAQGDLNVVIVMAIAFVAAMIGESIGFMLGHRYGMRLVRRLPFVNRFEDRIEAVQDHFKRHGGKTVAVGRYATAAGAVIPFAAGMGGMPYRRVLMFDAPAVLLWAIGITLIGYIFGSNLDLVETILSRFGWGILGLLVALIVGRVLWGRLQRRRAERAEGSGSEAESDREPSAR
jgi:membrane-associated protein